MPCHAPAHVDGAQAIGQSAPNQFLPPASAPANKLVTLPPGLEQLRALKHPIAFGNYSKENDLGGVTTWMESLIYRLHADGVPIVVELLFYGDSIPDSGIWTRLQTAGIPVQVTPCPLEKERAEPVRYVREILAFLNQYSPQVFLPNCRNSLYFAAAIAGSAGLPWVFTIHSDDPLFWDAASAASVKKSGGIFVGGSQYICEQVIKTRLHTSPQLIAYGVPIPTACSAYCDQPFRIAYAARIIEEQKRFSLVLQALALACRKDHRIECWIIGDGPAAESSRAWVAHQGLGERMQFKGKLDLPNFRDTIRQCQATLLMSDYEGLPISLLEAMACGVVPVARAIPSGIPELVLDGETGLLVDANPERAATALIRLVDDPDLWRRCSQASRRLIAENYGEDISYYNWVELLAKLSDKNSIQYPLSIPKSIPIPFRYRPAILEFQAKATRMKWQLHILWYCWFLPVLLIPRNATRRLFNSLLRS